MHFGTPKESARAGCARSAIAARATNGHGCAGRMIVRDGRILRRAWHMSIDTLGLFHGHAAIIR